MQNRGCKDRAKADWEGVRQRGSQYAALHLEEERVREWKRERNGETRGLCFTSSGGSASAQAEVEADGLVHRLGCLKQRRVDWSRGPRRGSVGLAERSFAPGPRSKQT